METNIQKTERLIREINRIHTPYSQDYFETGKVQKINLSHTLQKVPREHILSYRLNLHEAINDYLPTLAVLIFSTVSKPPKTSTTKSLAIANNLAEIKSTIMREYIFCLLN